MKEVVDSEPKVVILGEIHGIDYQDLMESFDDLKKKKFTDFVYELPRNLDEPFQRFLKSGRLPEECYEIYREYKRNFPRIPMANIKRDFLPVVTMLYCAANAGLNVHLMDVDTNTSKIAFKIQNHWDRFKSRWGKEAIYWADKRSEILYNSQLNKNFEKMQRGEKTLLHEKSYFYKKEIDKAIDRAKKIKEYAALVSSVIFYCILRNLSMGYCVEKVARSAKGNILVLTGRMHIEDYLEERSKAIEPYLQDVLKLLGVKCAVGGGIDEQNKEFILSRVEEACQKQEAGEKNEQELRKIICERFFDVVNSCPRELRVWEIKKPSKTPFTSEKQLAGADFWRFNPESRLIEAVRR